MIADIRGEGAGAASHGRYMPAWGRALTDRQLRDVVAYLSYLQAPR